MSGSNSTSAVGPNEIAIRLPQQLRKLRRARNLSLESLGAIAGVSRSMLSQIERGEANPTLAVTVRISRALGVSLDDIAGIYPDSASIIEVIRADDRSFDFRTDPECFLRTLSPSRLWEDVEFYELSLAPGRSLTSAPHIRGTLEFLAIEHGKVAVSSGEKSEQLGAGDSASYPADVAHVIENRGEDTATAFLVVRYLGVN
jgi:transcriptional regulator with XRE-family HTH domain